MRFAFISRHQPTPEQHSLARLEGIELVAVGDRDAFTVERAEFSDFDGVIVVHPAMALRLSGPGFYVGVFENANRAPEGEKPHFVAKALHVYDWHDQLGILSAKTGGAK